MAEDRSEDLMGYDALAQEALRGVIRAALSRAATPEGLPGGHHLYISFKTRAVGVSIPPDLIERYPDEMTIVLQHQFWDLDPNDGFFAITLRFGGQPKRISVPYSAVTRFYDPSCQFLLQFEVSTVAGEAATSEVVPIRPRPVEVLASDHESHHGQSDSARSVMKPAAPEAAADGEDGGDDDGDGPKIVSLDRFRKK